MAAHSAQGPQLGLPQMIQSRPQFGYVGAILVWLFAYLQYAGFNVFNTLLAADVDAQSPSHGSTKLWIVVVTVVAAVAAIVGYDLIHRMERCLTYGFLVLFGILTIVVFTLPYPAGSFDLGHFDLAPFLLAVLRGRRLPDQLGDLRLGLLALPAAGRDRAQDLLVDLRRLRARRGCGSWSSARRSPRGPGGVRHDRLAAGGRRPVLRRLRRHHPGLLRPRADLGDGAEHVRRVADPDQRLDSFKRVRPTLGVRLVDDRRSPRCSRWSSRWRRAARRSSTNFENFLLLVLYFFIPWTAVNLVDYFVVRTGHYAIARDLQARRHLRPVGLARHRVLPRRASWR